MFTRIAPRYDLLNHLLSLQLDRIWRARTARILQPILEQGDAVVLDLCCGTGDLALALGKRTRAGGRIVGADFSHTMLMRAREKSAEVEQLKVESEKEKDNAETHSAQWNTEAQHRRVTFVEADGMELPFGDGTFDLVTTAFGFRNLANYETGLTEIRRALKPGGTLAILEFMEPKSGWFGDLYRWYFRTILPKVGAWISGDKAAYTYLPSSVARFLQPDELTALMQANGFEKVEARLWTGGTVALHMAIKKAT